MAALTVQKPGLTGVVPSFVAAAGGGDTFVNDGETMIYVKNGGGAPITVTVDSLTTCDQGSDHDSVTSITNGTEKAIGPFEKRRFNDSTGSAAISYSAVTSVTIAVISLG